MPSLFHRSSKMLPFDGDFTSQVSLMLVSPVTYPSGTCGGLSSNSKKTNITSTGDQTRGLRCCVTPCFPAFFDINLCHTDPMLLDPPPPPPHTHPVQELLSCSRSLIGSWLFPITFTPFVKCSCHLKQFEKPSLGKYQLSRNGCPA